MEWRSEVPELPVGVSADSVRVEVIAQGFAAV